MSTNLKFIYMSESDMIKAGVLDMKGCLAALEEMFVLIYKGDYRMGGENANEHGIRVSFPEESAIDGMPLHKPDYRFMAMPAYLGGRFRMLGIKTYGSNSDNINKNLPRSILMMSLLDAETGIPLAYMSANILSAMRTGAAAGVGVKYLTKKNVKTVSVIGPGTMSRYTMRAFMEILSDVKILKIKGRGQESILKFINFCKENYPQIEEYIVCDSIEAACKDSDIIYYATTNAAKYEDNPNIKKEWVSPGALVISASSLLVDTDFLASPDVKLIADNYKMYDGWGHGNPLPTQKSVSTLLGMGFYDAVTEGKITREIITDIGEIICEKKTGRDNEDQIILYAVGGMPLEDVAWAYDCFQNARENEIGTQLNIWDIPQL